MFIVAGIEDFEEKRDSAITVELSLESRSGHHIDILAADVSPSSDDDPEIHDGLQIIEIFFKSCETAHVIPAVEHLLTRAFHLGRQYEKGANKFILNPEPEPVQEALHLARG